MTTESGADPADVKPPGRHWVRPRVILAISLPLVILATLALVLVVRWEIDRHKIQHEPEAVEPRIEELFSHHVRVGIHLDEVWRVDFEHIDTEVTDAMMANLASWPSIEELSLATHHFHGNGLEHVAGLKKLRFLMLSGSGVRNEDLKHLTGLPELKVLLLSELPLTNSALQHVSTLTTLQTLRIDGTDISDSGLRYLRVLTRLESLDLGRTSIGDAGLAYLAELPELRSLTCERTRVTDAGLPDIMKIRSLEYVNLALTHVSPEGIARLRAEMPDLEVAYHLP